MRGDQRGRELGYPTANVEVVQGIAIPPDGVYAGWLIVDGVRLAAAISIGTNPQFSGAERRVEAHAIDREDLDLYGAAVAVDLVIRLRGQKVFDSVDALVEQMGSTSLLRGRPWGTDTLIPDGPRAGARGHVTTRRGHRSSGSRRGGRRAREDIMSLDSATKQQIIAEFGSSPRTRAAPRFRWRCSPVASATSPSI